jgi:hypothetical protein
MLRKIPTKSWQRRHVGAWAFVVARDMRLIASATLGERLASLRLCDATALAAVHGSLERYGQLTALTPFDETDQLEILDGFKRVRAAQALGWTTLLARIDDVDAIEAKLRVAELHDRRGLTELGRLGLFVRCIATTPSDNPRSRGACAGTRAGSGDV